MVLYWRRYGRAGGCRICKKNTELWGCSSVGRAPALQAGGQEFESLHLHWRQIRSRFHTYLENRILKTISKKKSFLKEGENRKKGTEYSKTSEELREERSKTNREKQETDKAIEPNPLKNEGRKRCNAMHRRLSKEEHRVDALALRAEERRDKLRKVPGRSTYPEIRKCLNGETRLSNP